MTFVLTRRLDLRDRNGPDVVVALAYAMDPLASDALVEVLASDPSAVGAIATWTRRVGYQLLESSRFDTTFRFVLRKGPKSSHRIGTQGKVAEVATG